MKYLIVNADDFGYSLGINRGIIEAHEHGIVTSTSVMVDEIGANEARNLVKYPNLSVGLHLVIKEIEQAEPELGRQVAKFTKIVGRQPDHIDTHKMSPDDKASVRELLAAYGKEHHISIRALGYAKLIKSFFGLSTDGSGALDESHVTFDGFKTAIDEATEEFNELMCHVGYSDDYLRSHSSYNDIREQELAVITSAEVRQLVLDHGLTLCSWRQINV